MVFGNRTGGGVVRTVLCSFGPLVSVINGPDCRTVGWLRLHTAPCDPHHWLPSTDSPDVENWKEALNKTIFGIFVISPTMDTSFVVQQKYTGHCWTNLGVPRKWSESFNLFKLFFFPGLQGKILSWTPLKDHWGGSSVGGDHHPL